MRNEEEVLHEFSELRRETLYVWIERGWIAPSRGKRGYRFREIDVARLKLISEFRSDLDLDEEALDVVLPLLDQVHGLRRELRRLVDVINALPPAVRTQIKESLSNQD